MGLNQEPLAGDVVGLYEEELRLYRSLLAIALEVRNQLQAGKVEFDELLAAQAKLTQEIDRVEEPALRLRKALAAQYGCADLTLAALKRWPAPDARLQRLREVLSQVARVLEELTKEYASNQRLMEERLGEIRSEQVALNRAKQAAQAYRDAHDGEPAPRFLDKRS